MPIVDQHAEGETVASWFCTLGCYRMFSFGRWVLPLRHVAHDRRGRLARFCKRHRRAGTEGDAPFVAMQRVLAQVGPATAGRYAHCEPALGIVENEPIFATGLGYELSDFPLCELHRSPWCALGPQRVRGPLADLPHWHSLALSGVPSQGMT